MSGGAGSTARATPARGQDRGSGVSGRPARFRGNAGGAGGRGRLVSAETRKRGGAGGGSATAVHHHGSFGVLGRLSHNCRLLICSGAPVHLRQLFDPSNGDKLLKTLCSSSLTFQDHELCDSLWDPP